MTRADLLALAARCEAAQGADRELDAEIAEAAGWEFVFYDKMPNGTRSDLSLGYPPGSAKWTDVPRYTSSLDAAASLYPYRAPDMIPSDPRKASAAALRARAAGMEDDDGDR